MTNKEYRAREELSKSDLDLILRCPFEYKNKELFHNESKNLILGQAFHKLALEPQSFESEFMVAPQVDKRTKAGKEIYEKFLLEIGDKQEISNEQYQLILSMKEELFKHSETKKLLENGEAEQSYFGEINGIKVKCRPDFYNEKLGLCIDLKTTDDASPKGFASSVAKFNYHMQSAFYAEILRQNGKCVNDFLFIAVEKSSPHLVGFYRLDDEALAHGVALFERGIEKFKECLEVGFYAYAKNQNGKLKKIQTLSLPKYKIYEEIG